MSKITGVIFDADGMIVHGERFSQRLAREHGIFLETTAGFFSGAFQECIVGAADLKEELSKVILEWGWQGGTEDLLALWFDPQENRIDSRFESVVEALKKRGIKIFLATNNDSYRTKYLLDQAGLREWFDDVFASGFLGHKKPSHEFFQAILEKTQLSRDELWFWDDDDENIASARGFGIKTDQFVSFEDFERRVREELAI